MIPQQQQREPGVAAGLKPLQSAMLSISMPRAEERDHRAERAAVVIA